MKKDVEVPNVGLIEKEYPYRYRWSSIISMLLIGGFGTLFMVQAALSWIFTLLFASLFFWALYVSVINIWGNRRLIITKDKIYLPQIHKSEKYVEILFSDITNMDIVEVYGNGMLRLFVKRKEYTIVHSWLPSVDVFNEIVQHVSNKIKIHP
jgi:hypothetical protein